MAAPSLSGVQAGGDYLATGNNKAATSASMTTTAGRGFVAFVVWQDNSATPTLTDSKSNGAWTPGTLRTWSQYGTTVYMQQFLLPAMAAAGASHTVTTTHTVADSFPTMFVMEVVNPGGTLGIDTQSFATDGASPYDSSLTSVAADVLMLCLASPSNTDPTLAYTGNAAATGWSNPYTKAGTGLWNLAAFAQAVATPAATPISITYSVPQDAELHGMAIMGIKATSSNVTLALTGNESTAAVGTVTPAPQKALTSGTGTGAVGTVTQSRTRALTGNAGTAAVDSVVETNDQPLAGTQALADVGTVAVGGSPDVTAALTGAQGDAVVGDVVETNDNPLAGVEATAAQGDEVPGVALDLVGTGATASVGDLLEQNDGPLAGIAATGAPGTIAADMAIALTGAQGDSAVGNVSAGSDVSTALTAASAVGAPGDAIVLIATNVSGAGATAGIGAVSETNDQALAGVAAAAALGVLTPSVTSGDVTVGLTGSAAVGQVEPLGPGVDRALTGAEVAADAGALLYGASFVLGGVEATGTANDFGVAFEPTMWVRWRALAEYRSLKIAAERRAFAVAPEARTYTIRAERRAAAIPAGPRTWKMRP